MRRKVILMLPKLGRSCNNARINLKTEEMVTKKHIQNLANMDLLVSTKQKGIVLICTRKKNHCNLTYRNEMKRKNIIFQNIINQSQKKKQQPYPKYEKKNQNFQNREERKVNQPYDYQRAPREDKNKKVQFYTYDFLKSLSEKSLVDLKVDLFAQCDQLVDRINGTKFRDEAIPSYIMKIIEMLLQDKHSEISSKILNCFAESQFFLHLSDQLKEFLMKPIPNPEKRFNYLMQSIEVVSQFIDMYESRIHQFPVMDIFCISSSMKINPLCSLSIREKLDLESSKLQLKYMTIIQNKQIQNIEKKEERKQKVIKVDDSYKNLPVEDFKQIDVIPGEFQLRQLRSNLRKMPDKGDLMTSHNYLDLLFRLLFEDAISDLRNGVIMMSKIDQDKMSRKDFKYKVKDTNIKLHDQLQINSLEVMDGAGCIQFRLPTNKKQFLDWRISKKLLPGSLVVLSCDKFANLIIGLLKNRDAEQMNKTHQKYGYVPINIEIIKSTVPFDSLYMFFESYVSRTFQMIESGAYFESYKHVLKQLQAMDTWIEMPLSEYFVNGISNPRTPSYLTEMINNHRVQIVQELNQLKLDASQRLAFNKALTSDLSLIQGPPGTGKTYIGVQIVKTLLNYSKYWNRQGPILLVTYTNHAINQFLHHIKDFTKKIVRIGGKCDDEEMKQFNFREQLRNCPSIRGFYPLRKKIDYEQVQIRQCKYTLYKYQIGFINTMISKLENDFAHQIMDNLRHNFPNFLDEQLQPYKDQGFKIFAREQIKILRDASSWNILTLFWLGIIDLPKYIYSLQTAYLEMQNKNNQMQNDQKQDLLDDDQNYDEEREKDYDKYDGGNDQDIDAMWDVLNQAYSIQTVNQFFIGAESMQECLYFASNMNFQDPELGQIIMQESIERNLFTNISFQVKWQINNLIIRTLQQKEAQKLDRHIEYYKSLCKQKEELEAISAYDLLSSSHIIAMTTTGRAKYSSLFKDINFPIIIVEEAAEVFEAHIIASLSKNTQHLILIGDHQQLRPNPAVYELSQNFNLSMSMFERLINNHIEHATLGIQRRMRPEISRVMKFIYPDLEDHPDVLKYPPIKGISSSLYFFDHRFLENTHEMMQSKFNQKEAEMVVRFTWYLIQQNYKPTQITILTLYAGQLLNIKGQVKNNPIYSNAFKGIRVVNVDNYQGEENDIIILSLVRSNLENQIGFLKTTNRVCVALSRARQGLFIFGNSLCLVGSKLELWKQVIDHLKENSFLGDSLKFKCVNHDKVTEVRKVEDFKNVPEGGCELQCNVRMECGHSCPSKCHPFVITDIDKTGHSDKKCKKKCERPRICGHDCTYQCDQCIKQHQFCKTKVDKKFEPCMHIMSIDCGDFAKIDKCRVDCDKILKCGHKCKLWCSNNCDSRPCKENVIVKLSDCGHEIEMRCDENPLTAKCYKSCKKILPCGHGCPGKCGDCSITGEHKQCSKNCKRSLICGHDCKYPCTKYCPPCEKSKCNTKCKHSKCSLSCCEVCILCKELCDNKCIHSSCTRLCSEPCDRSPCNKHCQYLLKCGHPCIGLCGENCPNVCRVCRPDNESFDIMFGMEDDHNSRFVQIDCGHIFEVSAFDQYMSIPATAIKYKDCPKCKKLIMECRRYMNQINQVLNDINKVKYEILKENQALDGCIQKAKKYLKKLEDNIKTQDRRQELFKFLDSKIFLIAKDLNYAISQRSSDELNKVISFLQFAKDLYLLAVLISDNLGKLTIQQEQYVKKIFLQAKVSFKSSNDFDQVLASQVRTFNNSIKDLLKIDKLEVMIQAIGLSKGHWNKCPNGHLYVIGDCGGAMEESKCPDCNSVIGGHNHQLARGNAHASQLGGRPAWDPAGFDAQMLRGQVNIDDIIHHH